MTAEFKNITRREKVMTWLKFEVLGTGYGIRML